MFKLRQKVEGKASGKFGYTILVFKMIHLSEGVLNEDTGNAQFTVEYLAMIFKPFVGEVLPGEVTSLSKTGFFVQAGPMEIFVSSQLMPEELKFDVSTGSPSFVAEDDEDDDVEFRISIGSRVRVKIIGMRFAANDIHVIGSIKDDYLGPFS